MKIFNWVFTNILVFGSVMITWNAVGNLLSSPNDIDVLVGVIAAAALVGGLVYVGMAVFTLIKDLYESH